MRIAIRSTTVVVIRVVIGVLSSEGAAIAQSQVKAMRDLINRGAMPGRRMLVSGYGLLATSSPFRPSGRPAEGGLADGVPEVLRAVRQQVAAGVDCIKMYASTASDQDVTGFQTFMKGGAVVVDRTGTPR